MITSTHTVLSRVTKNDIAKDFFPHVVLKNAIDVDVVEKLITEYPKMKVVSQGDSLESNKRFSLPASVVFKSSEVSDVWKEFIRIHTTQDFWLQFVHLFKDSMGKSLNGAEHWRVGVRNIDNFDTADVLLDAQICINSPVVDAPTSVRGAHLDDPRKVYGGLWYVRLPDDDSEGGQLVTYTYNQKKPVFFGQEIDYAYVTPIAQVEYEKNSLVLFGNTFQSLHGVTPRQKTTYPRLFMNLVAEVKDPLFDIQRFQGGYFRRCLRNM